MSNSLKFIKVYKRYAVIAVNTILLVIILLVIFSVGGRISGKFKDTSFVSPVESEYGEVIFSAYPGFSRAEVRQLLNETWNRSFKYEPFVQFMESPRTGRFVNVHPAGFRSSVDQCAWPPQKENYNVFVFGGSTTFGYGVPDDKTIVSFLEKNLNSRMETHVCAYNFGQGYYFSTQEMLLFIKLVHEGFVPQMAVFIDGINDFETEAQGGQLQFTRRLAQYMHPRAAFSLGGALSQAFQGTYLYKAIRSLTQQFEDKQAIPDQKDSYDQVRNFYTEKSDDMSRNVIKNYFKTKKIIDMIAEENGVKTYFVWQPMLTYKYNFKKWHQFKVTIFQNTVVKNGYVRMRKYFRQPQEDNLIWCADVQELEQQPLYVDGFHYSDKLSKMIADCIADGIKDPKQ